MTTVFGMVVPDRDPNILGFPVPVPGQLLNPVAVVTEVVTQIAAKTKPNMGQTTAIGAAVGAGAGLVATAAFGGGIEKPEKLLSGGGFGAVVGAAVGAYQAYTVSKQIDAAVEATTAVAAQYVPAV